MAPIKDNHNNLFVPTQYRFPSKSPSIQWLRFPQSRYILVFIYNYRALKRVKCNCFDRVCVICGAWSHCAIGCAIWYLKCAFAWAPVRTCLVRSFHLIAYIQVPSQVRPRATAKFVKQNRVTDAPSPLHATTFGVQNKQSTSRREATTSKVPNTLHCIRQWRTHAVVLWGGGRKPTIYSWT